MLSKSLTKALNEQINKEISASYVYLGVAHQFDSDGLKGFASWMKLQAKEELEHAMRIYDFLTARDAKVELMSIPAPKIEEGEPLEMLKQVLAHEQSITQSIHEAYSLAREEKDYASESFLIWFLNEQTEEESILRDYIDEFKFVDGKTGILFMDKKFGERSK